jgi:hypothetical protein
VLGLGDGAIDDADVDTHETMNSAARTQARRITRREG